MKYCVRHELAVLSRAEFIDFDDATRFAAVMNRELSEPVYIVTELVPDVSSLLSQAYNTVNQDRRNQYGAPEDEFANVALMWQAILGPNVDIPPRKVALMMIALKLCRESVNHKHDNLVDIVGYTLCLERVVSE